MTREEARKAANIMMAYADGKEVEFLDTLGNWRSDTIPAFNWFNFDYRIKQEPTYRPFKDKKECWAEMQKHQPFGWVINKNTKSYKSLLLLNEDLDSYKHLFQQLVFTDGTPFGIKEE